MKLDRPHGLGQTFSVIAAAGAVDGFGLNVCEELGFSSVRKKGGQKEIWMPLATGGATSRPPSMRDGSQAAS